MRTDTSRATLRGDNVLLLLLSSVLLQVLSDTQPIHNFLSSHSSAAVLIKRILLLAASFLLVLFWRVGNTWTPLRGKVALAASIFVALSIVGYVAYAEIPLSMMLSSTMLAAFVQLWVKPYFRDSVLLVTFCGSLFALRGARIALVAASTVMCLIWGTAH
jgi:hypothetical protein